MCHTNCPANLIEDLASGTCLECPPECSACDAMGCTGCNNNLTLENNQCTTNCLDGFYYDGIGCVACSSNCETCSGTLTNCQSCPSGYWLNSGFCQKECLVSEVWVQPNNCEACDQKCDSCLNVTRTCNIELNYDLKASEFQPS
jgi:proprotein convertase subtilisin/kexin type 5